MYVTYTATQMRSGDLAGARGRGPPDPRLLAALAGRAARLHHAVDRQRVRRVLLHLLGRLVVGHDGHDLVERAEQRQRGPGEPDLALAVELGLHDDRNLALADADQADVPVVDVHRLDLGQRGERLQRRPVADARATDADVVDLQAALVDAAVADVADRDEDVLAGVGRQVIGLLLEPGRR